MTLDQQAAVDTTVGDLAIKAGAGSGKTTVLAHRFAHALLPQGPSGEPRAAIDRVLTITFTNKAAGEIAERVRRVVTAELGAGHGRRIGEAWISTIHAFCARLVRRHILESGVEPYFGMCDEVATATLKNEAFERAARGLYGSDERAVAAIDAFTVGQLRERVIACYDNARALGLDPRQVTVPVGFDEIPRLADEVMRKADLLAEAMGQVKQTESIREKRERLDAWCGEVSACSFQDEDACARLLALDDAYDISRLREQAQTANAELKIARASLRSALLAVKHSEVLAGLEALMREFAEQYPLVKSERSLLDFDDLQERAVSLLEDDPLIAARYRDQFDLIMVDEFQDTNELQMRVLSPIRSNNLCIVGDERQSIYGFRYADVEIFEELAERVEQRIPLRANFRSHAGVLGFVNATFSGSHLFGSSFMQLEARREGGWRTALADEPRVECVLVDDEGSNRADCRAVEARHIARRVRELLDSGVRGGDVAILLRGAGSAGTYAGALEAEGVPVLVSAGSSLFDSPEVDDVSALLRTIAVPADDRALLAVLAGRLIGLSDDALVAVRRAAGHEPLWSGLESLATATFEPQSMSAEDLHAIRYAAKTIDQLGASAGTMRLAELVRRSCEAFDYDLVLYTHGSAGARAWENVLKIARYAEAFEQAESNDPVEFVEYLKRRGVSGKDKAAPAQAGDGAVRMMTIHAAKGLEFPVVFVADLAIARIREPESVLVEAGEVDGRRVPVVGVKLPKTHFEGAATPAYVRMAERRRLRDVEEEKRCLYVACTRAEELLVVSGCCSLGKPPQDGRGMIDWIRESLPAGEGAVTRVGGVDVHVARLAPEDDSEASLAAWEPALPSGQLFATAEPAQPTSTKPAVPNTVSFSALRRLQRCPLSFYAADVLQLGSFRPPSEGSATKFGSAVHAALQASMLRELADDRALAIASRFGLSPAEQAELKRVVVSFLSSELAKRARAADRFAAEEPLSVPLGASLLLGSIDLIAWKGDSALIVDYKTGGLPASSSQEHKGAYELQAECYALAALRAGASQVEVVFSFLQQSNAEVTYHFTVGDAQRLEMRLAEILAGSAASDSKHLAEYDAAVCSGCPALGGICPVKQPVRRR